VPALVLVRYGELALKSPPVRRAFERQLERNILDQFLRDGAACRLRADRGHLYVETDDPEGAVRRLRRVFGVTSVSPVREVPTDPAAIESALLERADGRLAPGVSFAIRARRTGSHSFTSQELARRLGAAVLARWPERGLRVELDRPEVELHVEVRGPRTYLYFDRAEGPGGLPLGVAGRAVALVDGARGALGAFLLMKRGCRCALLAPPEGRSLARDVLTRFDPKAVIVEAEPGTDPSNVDASLRALAQRSGADAVVLPLAVEAYGAARDAWSDRVVFSPTVAWADDEVEARWRAVAALAE
jgi:thiamine biosynthesis protein ThiI